MWRQWHLRAQQANGPESGVWRHAICEHGKEELVCSCKKFKVTLGHTYRAKKHVKLSCKYYRSQLGLCQGSRWLASVVMASRRRAPCRAVGIGVCCDTEAQAHSRPIRGQCQLDVRRARLACAVRGASLPPCHWTSRGRMRGVGATCTAPTTQGRPKHMTDPKCCQIGAG